MLKEKIQKQIDEHLQENPDIFLISYSLSPRNDVEVVIDGDNGVSIEDCLKLSRKIENNVDRELEDYALRVSSYGISNPLMMPRQFLKNIGKKIALSTKEGEKIKGNISKAEEEGIEVEWKERVPKEIGKGKVSKTFTQYIKYNDIEKANIIITF